MPPSASPAFPLDRVPLLSTALRDAPVGQTERTSPRHTSGVDRSSVAYTAQNIAIRVTLGSLLGGAVLNATVLFGRGSTAHDGQDARGALACALNVAVCVVAAYHYTVLSRLVHDDDKSVLETETRELQTSVQGAQWTRKGESQLSRDSYVLEQLKDSVRYSADHHAAALNRRPLHLGGGRGKWFSSGVGALLAVVLVLLGSVSRFGADAPASRPASPMHFVPSHVGRGAPSAFSNCCGLLGTFAFLAAWVVLALLVVDVSLGSAQNKPDATGTVLLFILPWSLYGLVELTSIIVRTMSPSSPLSYSLGLSVAKDVAYGLLDCYSKFGLSVYTALTYAGPIF